MTTPTETEVPDTYKQLAQLRSEARSGTSAKEETLAAGEVTTPPAPEAPVAEAAPVEETPAPEAAPEPVEEILIDGKVFTSQKEAIKYAQQLAQDKIVNEAYYAGIKDSLQSVQPAKEEAPAEDNFEQEFYTDPKKTINKVKEEAKREAVEAIRAETTRESQWQTFLTKYPDIDREDAELVLQRNNQLFSQNMDVDKAMQLLATKTRAEYQRIASKFTPTKELANKGGQVVSPSGKGGPVVTTQKKVDEPLDFISQLKNHRAKR